MSPTFSPYLYLSSSARFTWACSVGTTFITRLDKLAFFRWEDAMVIVAELEIAARTLCAGCKNSVLKVQYIKLFPNKENSSLLHSASYRTLFYCWVPAETPGIFQTTQLILITVLVTGPGAHKTAVQSLILALTFRKMLDLLRDDKVGQDKQVTTPVAVLPQLIFH